MLKNKKILLGITASIAAYKAAFLVRLLVKQGAEVKVILTDAAREFITPLTLSTLSKNKVYTEFSDKTTGEWSNHVELGLWADLMLIAPTSANTISKMANGICDNLMLATYLSARCPVMFAPAMDLDMYVHPSTVHNIQKLQSFGNLIIDAEEGELASGLSGKGRMAEPENILTFIEDFFSKKNRLSGKKILITAGPTYENIDPVRFIGNYSSGKMGFALAETCADEGAEVILVSGPSQLKSIHPNIQKIDVRSAEQMYETCKIHFQKCNSAIMSAAVADYTPAYISDHKIKKTSDDMQISLKKTIDILKYLGHAKNSNQVVIGFALETNDGEVYAKEKLESKNADMIVLNSLQDEGSGFGTDTNKVSFFVANEGKTDFPLLSKQQVAQNIVNKMLDLLNKKNSNS
jgi:phosphopantothenoylcysteine decarboxylase/phosphopantothenate--cysteine ligase